MVPWPGLFTTSHHDAASKADLGPYEFIAALIDLGADPTQLHDDGGSILIGPIFSQDGAMVELLLARGVDPNRGCGDPSETVCDLAFFDYHFEAWMKAGEPEPEWPDGVGLDDEDTLLRHLDCDAQRYGRLRPDILLLLRKHGALSRLEMARKLGGDGSERIEWRDDGWHLAQPRESSAQTD